MSTLRSISSIIDTKAHPYDFFFNKIDYHLSKGKGFSLYHADDAAITNFLEQCNRKGYSPLTARLSSVEDALSAIPASPTFVTLIQDLPYFEFLEQAPLIADKLVFPFWFRRIPICFFSYPGREAYETDTMNGENLHKNSSLVIRALLAEQVFTILNRSNVQFASPEFINLPEHKTIFTPIEEKMLTALEAHQLAYQPQVRIGRYTVDFLVGVQDQKVIVECDGKAYHDPAKDSERDKVLSLEGYPICRFSGSDIYADVEKCIETIQEALNYRTQPSYTLDDDLDSSQQAAVTSVNGPIRVLAPAGSGKTKTLVNRILYLLNQGIAAEKILALAFNKKARDEMQDRLDRRGVHGVEVRTFHSFGYEIVREGLGWTFNGSTHKKTSRALMQSAILQHTELPPRRNKDPLDAFLAGLRKAKMELPALSTVTVEYGDRIYPLEPIFYSYLKKQLNTNFVDFDDMIYLAIRLLLENNSLRHIYQSRFEFVLVDEFQDLNEAQLLLLQIIALPENNIFAVGDDDQMIYGFRGADVKHIVEFDKRFPLSSNHVLNTNYRSSQMIVRHTGWLINHNVDRVNKEIRPRKDAQIGRFEVSGHASLFEQAECAAKWLVNHKKEHSLNWRDYAVLYRYNAYQFPIAVILDTMGIPHSPVSGQQLFHSMVGIDIFSYLQVTLYPEEATASDFDRILKRPNKYFTNQLISHAKNWNSFKRLPEIPALRDWEREKLTDFITRIEQLSKKARAQDISAIDYLQILKTELGLEDFYRDQSRKSDDLDQASDEGFLDVITALAENFKTPVEFFQFICKSIDEHDSDSGNSSENGNSETGDSRNNEIYLSTIHRAKGKEFQNVVYFNLSKTDADSKQAKFIEEERRVAYVGATRPKDDLLITFSSAKPSDFLTEISLNPKFKGTEEEEMKSRFTSCSLRLEKAKVHLKQLEAKKEKGIADFHELTETQSGKWPTWSQGVIWRIQNWRMDKTKARIERIDRQIKKHAETTIAPLLKALQEMEEERNIRSALGLRQ